MSLSVNTASRLVIAPKNAQTMYMMLYIPLNLPRVTYKNALLPICDQPTAVATANPATQMAISPPEREPKAVSQAEISISTPLDDMSASEDKIASAVSVHITNVSTNTSNIFIYPCSRGVMFLAPA